MFYLCKYQPYVNHTDILERISVVEGPEQFTRGRILLSDRGACMREAVKAAVGLYIDANPDWVPIVSLDPQKFAEVIVWDNPNDESAIAEVAKENPGGAETLRKLLPKAKVIQHAG
jgi:hypothetical protein